jgi:hypothetical protein
MRDSQTLLFLALLLGGPVLAQSAPVSPDQPWHSANEQKIEAAAKPFLAPGFSIEATRTYSLAGLVDIAEAHNPETRVAWERARAQMAALGIARSELYPTIAALALSETLREETFFGTVFYRQTIQTFGTTFDLRYTFFEAVAVLHQGMAQITLPRLLAVALLVQSGVAVSGRCMRLVTTLLATEVRAVVIVVGAVLRAEALLRGPGLDQRAIHGEVLTTHKALGLPVDLTEELLRDRAAQKSVAVLRKQRVVPYRIVHTQADGPTKQQLVIELIDQLPSERIE